jgi:hypothetical protein
MIFVCRLFTSRSRTSDTLSVYKIIESKEEGLPLVNKQQIGVNKQQQSDAAAQVENMILKYSAADSFLEE